MIEPMKAVVRPRVFAGSARGVVLLEDKGSHAKTIFSPDLSDEQVRLLYVPGVLLLLAVEAAWHELENDARDERFRMDWTRELMTAVAPQVAAAPAVQDKLRSWLINGIRDYHPLAISLLNLSGSKWDWPPTRVFSFPDGRMNLAGAILDDADCTRMSLARCHLEGASFARAQLSGANLRRVIANNAIFAGADLRKSNLTIFAGGTANFSGADLSELSRSGIVESSIPMEGSRTGFYRDEWNEQDFKSPEEIRKANLRGADLRGAMIDGVDFYLVDLRDARYDKVQVEPLRRTGAILETRIC